VSLSDDARLAAAKLLDLDPARLCPDCGELDSLVARVDGWATRPATVACEACGGARPFPPVGPLERETLSAWRRGLLRLFLDHPADGNGRDVWRGA
jgi:hypothetical protein